MGHNAKPAVEQPAVEQPATFQQQLEALNPSLSAKQQTALTNLLAEIAKYRGDSVIVSSPSMLDRRLVVLVNGARVAIGTGGGYEALDISTYNPPNMGITYCHFMAYADVHLAKQTARRASKDAGKQSEITVKTAENQAAAATAAAAATIANK